MCDVDKSENVETICNFCPTIGQYLFSDCQNHILTNYLDMRKLYTVPQLFQPWVIFEQDGPPPHLFLREIFYYFISLNVGFGRSGPIAWPPHSPDIHR